MVRICVMTARRWYIGNNMVHHRNYYDGRLNDVNEMLRRHFLPRLFDDLPNKLWGIYVYKTLKRENVSNKTLSHNSIILGVISQQQIMGTRLIIPEIIITFFPPTITTRKVNNARNISPHLTYRNRKWSPTLSRKMSKLSRRGIRQLINSTIFRPTFVYANRRRNTKRDWWSSRCRSRVCVSHDITGLQEEKCTQLLFL